MADPTDLTLLVLREIRDELRTTRDELKSELASTRETLRVEIHGVADRVDVTNERVSTVETTLRDLAEQQRFVVRHLSALTSRDRTLETEVDVLRGRVDAIEKRLPG